MNRKKGILAAGTFTGLVLITLLALGFGGLGASAESKTAVPQEATALPQEPTTNLTTDEALQAWQQYSAELEQTVQTLQDRESTYAAQIEAANQTILQLQDQINSSNSAASSAAYQDDDDRYENDDQYENDDDRYENDDDDARYENEEYDDD